MCGRHRGCLHHPLGPSVGLGGLALCWRTFPRHHRADWVTYSDRIAHRRIKPAAVRPTRVGSVIRVASAGEYLIFVSASVFSLRSTLQMWKIGAGELFLSSAVRRRGVMIVGSPPPCGAIR